MPWRKKIWILLGLSVLKGKGFFHSLGKKSSKVNLPIRHIIYFEFTRAGDLICTSPFLSLLKKSYPQATLTLVVYKEMRTPGPTPGVRAFRDLYQLV